MVVTIATVAKSPPLRRSPVGGVLLLVLLGELFAVILGGGRCGGGGGRGEPSEFQVTMVVGVVWRRLLC